VKIGKTYKLKSGTIAVLQGVCRGITKGTLDGSVKHFVELSFQDHQDRDCYIVRVPFNERLKPNAEVIEKIIEAIVNGTPVPKSSPLDLIAPSEAL